MNAHTSRNLEPSLPLPTFARRPEASGCELRAATVVKSPYEQAFKECLLELGVKSYYEPFRLWVGSRQTITYTPDFVTELSIDGRRVIIEPHPMGGGAYYRMHRDLHKFRGFESKYRCAYYLVLASDFSEETLRRNTGMPLRAFTDEYWQIPHIIPGDSNGHSPATVKEIALGHMEVLLRKAN